MFTVLLNKKSYRSLNNGPIPGYSRYCDLKNQCPAFRCLTWWAPCMAAAAAAKSYNSLWPFVNTRLVIMLQSVSLKIKTCAETRRKCLVIETEHVHHACTMPSWILHLNICGRHHTFTYIFAPLHEFLRASMNFVYKNPVLPILLLIPSLPPSFLRSFFPILFLVCSPSHRRPFILVSFLLLLVNFARINNIHA